jgi:hypothetical protein|tara:strand:- start:84 stop:224 length:141 start_codon:yes stop_codon:yes gene_type:complete
MDDDSTLWYEIMINKIIQENAETELATQLRETSEEKTETTSDESTA